jgi:hypothetical protein
VCAGPARYRAFALTLVLGFRVHVFFQSRRQIPSQYAI